MSEGMSQEAAEATVAREVEEFVESDPTMSDEERALVLAELRRVGLL